MTLDSKGRTLLEILASRNTKDMRPLEFHNPLEAKVGWMVSFDHEPDIGGIKFVIEKISVYKTTIKQKDFYHTDYHLKGISLDHDKPVRLRMRLIPDDDLGHKVQLLYLYYEKPYDEDFLDNVLGDESGEYPVNQSDDGKELEEPRKYWRVGQTDHCLRPDPYKAHCTVLVDFDGDETVEDDELEHYSSTYWEFSRMTDDDDGQEYEEFLTIEMNDETGFFTFLRGSEVQASQIMVF